MSSVSAAHSRFARPPSNHPPATSLTSRQLQCSISHTLLPAAEQTKVSEVSSSCPTFALPASSSNWPIPLQGFVTFGHARLALIYLLYQQYTNTLDPLGR